MKKYLLYLLLSLLCSGSLLSQNSLQNEIYTFVEEMPYLKSCNEDNESYAAKKTCSDRTFIKYLAANIRLDSTDVFYGECCDAYVSFVINREGKIEDIEIVKGINKSFDARLLTLIESFPEWVPGKHKGKDVKVQIRLPIKMHPKY